MIRSFKKIAAAFVIISMLGLIYDIDFHSNKVLANTSLPMDGASLTKEVGDISHYNFVGHSSVRSYEDNRWTYKSTSKEIKDVKSFDGKTMYATTDDGYNAEILKWDSSTFEWNTVGSFRGGPIFDIVGSDNNILATGGGESLTNGINSSVYTSVNGDSDWSNKFGGYKSKKGNYSTSGYVGIVYTGVAVNEKILMFGNSYATNYISETLDGITFNKKSTFDGLYKDAIYNGDKVVAVGQHSGGTYSGYGLVAVSEDEGNSFETITLGYNSPMNAVDYKDGVYVAVGSKGSTYYSSDALNWTKAVTNTKETLHDVEWDELNQRFVAVGDSGTVLLSLDGEKWVSIDSGTTTDIQGIVMLDKR
ncbi:WD40/YVTN/BNR-like repeat-containing protein [Terribacillus saccharophilus]|uniref:Uncharacterized protein n=1 Tax=Terribacillus saccharophilus TaxID=361277 RepID=A0ABX4H0E2_9BACI|nr:hypothetical protein [Terribacillus saccharophilus]PAD35925.1 hypothetical protein CHH56_05735 [Terribacillus saccharophilus]PAD97025.1 hypothetical protein CHH50_06575 [Terribacillus saccharophilus]PAE00601.1 hypothetical protein CHH48_07480 [Terribacillus saccharophilus]